MGTQDKLNHYKWIVSCYYGCRSIVRMSNGVGTTLDYRGNQAGTGDIKPFRSTWNNYRIDVFGNTISAYREGILMNQFTDPSPGSPMGTIGFFTSHNRYTYFERLRVRGRRHMHATCVPPAPH